MNTPSDNKELTIESFLKILRIALNYIMLYSSEHSSFINSVGKLKQDLYILFTSMDSVTIGFTPDTLVIEGKAYAKLALHKELARIFHSRKIKSIQFRKGVVAAEIILLLEKVSLPTKEILAKGGVSRIIPAKTLTHITVEDLDYSQFLKDEGEEVSEIWSVMLNNAGDKESDNKIDRFADNFETIIAKLNARDIVENDELNLNLNKFLVYIRSRDNDRFRKCSQAIFKIIIKEKGLLKPENQNKVSSFFAELGEQDIADTLWETMSSEKGVDPEAFSFFSSLFGKDKGDRVALSFAKNVKDVKSPGFSSKINKKIKELFTYGDNFRIPEVYRHAIAALAEGRATQEQLFFDRSLIEDNYRFILLNLLADEDNEQKTGLILEKIFSQWDNIISQKDPEYLKFLWKVIKRKKNAYMSAPEGIGELEKRFVDFVEDMVWQDDIPEDFGVFFDDLTESLAGREFFIHNFFVNKKANRYALKLFFRLFPDSTDDFQQLLEKNGSDIEFLVKVMEGLRDIDIPISLGMLKHIFSFGNDLVKIEVLKAMSGLSDYDEKLLIGILRQDKGFLKKEAMRCLERNDELKEKGVKALFAVSNHWGRNNNVLLDNMDVVNELDLRIAHRHLKYLSRRFFFWHLPVSKKARQILEKWK